MSGMKRNFGARASWFPALAACAWAGALGCAQSSTAKARSVLPHVPAEQARCRVASSQSSPLVTEWPASEKANLEARLREGGVVVSYSGCSMKQLPQSCVIVHNQYPGSGFGHVSISPSMLRRDRNEMTAAFGTFLVIVRFMRWRSKHLVTHPF